MNRIRLLSFNIHGGRSLDGARDLGRVHVLMERLQIDIGVFQEMETRPACGGDSAGVARLAGPERPHVLPAPAMHDGMGGWYGNLIVSRFPIRRGLVHNLETDPLLEPRNAVDALIDTPHGALRVIGTHLSLQRRERRSEARNLIRLIREVEQTEPNPTLLMGDINEWQRPSALLRFLDSTMTPLPCAASFPSFFPTLKLDRAWHDAPGLHIKAHRLSGKGIRLLSDHLPLVLEVEFPA